MKANVKTTSDNDVKMVADEIMRQLQYHEYFWSWGVSKYAYLLVDNKPSLGILVNGFLYKGWLSISLNTMDTYDITLLGDEEDEDKVVNDVYCDQMHDVIDGLIEKDPSWSDEEYSERVDKWLATQA